MTIDKHAQRIGSGVLDATNLLMRFGVPRGSVLAEAASDAEPACGTSIARGLAANRRTEVFLDL
ncbi:hypothetical protein [Reyranella sp.]|uniref:hypothetical protein n=1 Tax=Reyranella sp. TaxID=1929291 RepID=UPI003D099AEF